ncbi:hypothetical protein [Flavobacterium columnare]|uniref:hypothetical protein n=1 Tax=Flavobacterium columnare TaxID=996 RepID=UPI003BA0ED9A
MSKSKKAELTKNNLEAYIFGGNQEVVNFVSNFTTINKDRLMKIYVKSDIIIIKDLNLLNFKEVERFIKEKASEKFSLYTDKINNCFISHSMPFGDSKAPSHYDANNKISALKMIEFSNFEDDEKQNLVDFINTFKYENSFSEIIYNHFDNNYDIKYKLNLFIEEIKNQDIDLYLRFQLLSDVLKQINYSILKNNEVINSRAYQYKKDISRKINSVIVEIKKQIETKLDYYVKKLSEDSYLGFQYNSEQREVLFGRLIKIETAQKFLKLEKRLINSNLLTVEKNRWLGTAKRFIEFYQFCENQNLFIHIYKENSKGVKILRKIYNFNEGQSIDKKSKRIKIAKHSNITYHSFLQDI